MAGGLSFGLSGQLVWKVRGGGKREKLRERGAMPSQLVCGCVGGFVCVSVWVCACVRVRACVQESRVCAWRMFRLVFLLANKSNFKVIL